VPCQELQRCDGRVWIFEKDVEEIIVKRPNSHKFLQRLVASRKWLDNSNVLRGDRASFGCQVVGQIFQGELFDGNDR
jgi:hypothetical protein